MLSLKVDTKFDTTVLSAEVGVDPVNETALLVTADRVIVTPSTRSFTVFDARSTVTPSIVMLALAAVELVVVPVASLPTFSRDRPAVSPSVAVMVKLLSLPLAPVKER